MPSAILPEPIVSGSDTEDSDFAASRSASGTEGSSSSDEEGKPIKKRKRAGDEEALASGDEGIVEDGQKKRRQKHKKKRKGKHKAAAAEGEDGYESEEGVGARLRRRREGKGERESKKKASKDSEAVTVDVEAVWARLNSAPSTKPKPSPPPDPELAPDGKLKPTRNVHQASDATPSTSADPSTSEMITIKRTYNFAGTTTTEEKLVLRESAEARLYFSSLKPPTTTDEDLSKPPLRRPLKRPSRFDTSAAPSSDLAKLMTALKAPKLQKSLAELKAERGEKLNTVDKSRLDWVSYVDKEKLKDELDKAEKAKGGYLDRMDFLGRSEMAREEGLRDGRKR